jgi:kinesin family member 5
MASAGARIAKPLRGGGGVQADMNGGPAIPILNSLSGSDSSQNKRSSWFFNKS